VLQAAANIVHNYDILCAVYRNLCPITSSMHSLVGKLIPMT